MHPTHTQLRARQVCAKKANVDTDINCLVVNVFDIELVNTPITV